MPERVDVAIIGGGIAGASVAYFLARLGVRNVLVLEKNAVASGASGRASGLVMFVTATHPTLAALLKASSDLYQSWEDEIGPGPALHRVGAVVPVSERHRPALAAEVGLMQAAGHAVSILDRAALAALVPGWRLDDVDLAAYSPDSGFIDPPMVTTALMNRARALGVRVYQGATVMGVRVEGGRVTGLDTDRGAVEAPVVVLAAGSWNRELGRLAGVDLEVWPVRHQVIHLRPPWDLSWPFPGCYDPYNGLYFRPEPGGLVLAANAGPDDYPDEPPGDPDRFDPTAGEWYGHWVMERLMRRIPAMQDAEIAGGHAGVYPKGSDGYPLLGPCGGVDRLYCICDTAGNGMTSSPGMGRALAELIVTGRSFVDLHPFRPSRFAEHDPVLAPSPHPDTPPLESDTCFT